MKLSNLRRYGNSVNSFALHKVPNCGSSITSDLSWIISKLRTVAASEEKIKECIESIVYDLVRQRAKLEQDSAVVVENVCKSGSRPCSRCTLGCISDLEMLFHDILRIDAERKFVLFQKDFLETLHTLLESPKAIINKRGEVHIPKLCVCDEKSKRKLEFLERIKPMKDLGY